MNRVKQIAKDAKKVMISVQSDGNKAPKPLKDAIEIELDSIQKYINQTLKILKPESTNENVTVTTSQFVEILNEIETESKESKTTRQNVCFQLCLAQGYCKN